MTKLLEPLLRSPLLPDLLREAQEVLNKERASREAFLKDLRPDVKSEFILGESLMHSPAKARHLRVTMKLAARLHAHLESLPDAGVVFVEKCLVSLSRNDFEPDIVWYSHGKANRFAEDQMRFPAPDFVVEVLSESTEERDRGIKFEDYALHGVTEYWIIDPDSKTVEKYLLNESEKVFDLAEKLGHGSVQSTVIDDFEISLNDLFSKA